jgi:dolichyl-diphosphooligosaccharide--protein glycosyltransferase
MTDENKKIKILNAIPFCVGVIVSFLIALYIRIVPKASVFLSNGFVCFGGNDPWYHLRNVESILHNFPHMLWFDAYTQYPYGTHQVFAPLFDMFLSTIIWILGLGNPSQDLINTVCAYYPAFLGALVVIPTYFAASWLFDDRRIGLLAGLLIAIAPGQFLSRSMIGFNDHHVAETLLTTIVSMFLIMTLKALEEHPITFENIKKMDYEALKPSLPYIILTGLALGSYSLAWYGAVFFCFVIGIYITVQYIVDHLHSRSTDYLAILGIIVFGISLLMVLMVPEMSSRGIILKGLIGGIIAFPLFSLISLEFNKRKINKYYYPLSIAALSIVVVALAKLFSQSIYELITSLANYFVRTGGGTTIAEASPLLIDRVTGEFTLWPFWYNFALAGILSIVALTILVYLAIYKHNNREQTFLIVWTLMIIWAMLQQNRFAYYYSVNAAILAAYLGIKILDLAGWKNISNPLTSKDLGKWFRQIKPVHVVVLVLVVLSLAYPSHSIASQQGVGGPNGYWIEAMLWLNSSTPDPGLDYYENYDESNSGEVYPYPETAYGVMSWWDYGHWIEVIGHRIPNANPFQQGIGGRRDSIEEENEPGASTFFTAQSEEEATAVLEAVHPDPDKAGARYVISDIEMASLLNGKFYPIASWTLDTADYYVGVQTDEGVKALPGERFYNSMESRLHIFDGNSLEQYRMVHESPIYDRDVTLEIIHKYYYNILFSGGSNIAETNTGYVKIFEYVKGATITGEAPGGEKVTISTTILTSTGRTFLYSQSAVSDGTFEFVVPYSTDGPIEGETQFDTMPVGPYTITYGNVTESVTVSETDVLDGNTIEM